MAASPVFTLCVAAVLGWWCFTFARLWLGISLEDVRWIESVHLLLSTFLAAWVLTRLFSSFVGWCALLLLLALLALSPLLNLMLEPLARTFDVALTGTTDVRWLPGGAATLAPYFLLATIVFAGQAVARVWLPDDRRRGAGAARAAFVTVLFGLLACTTHLAGVARPLTPEMWCEIAGTFALVYIVSWKLEQALMTEVILQPDSAVEAAVPGALLILLTLLCLGVAPGKDFGWDLLTGGALIALAQASMFRAVAGLARRA